MSELAASTTGPPPEGMMRFSSGVLGCLAGAQNDHAASYHPNSECWYKALEANATDVDSSKDTTELLNVAQDDVLARPKVVHRTYPPTADARTECTIISFIKKSVVLNQTFMNIFNAKLGLLVGSLARHHRAEEPSGSEARCIKGWRILSSWHQKVKVDIGAYTNSGSLVRV